MLTDFVKCITLGLHLILFYDILIFILIISATLFWNDCDFMHKMGIKRKILSPKYFVSKTGGIRYEEIFQIVLSMKRALSLTKLTYVELCFTHEIITQSIN